MASRQCRTQPPVGELRAGDLGVVAKLKDTLTGDSLGDKSAPIVYPKVKLAEPAISFAIEPKSRGDEDKLSTAIHRMLEEDLLLRFSRDPQTKEFLLSGAGQQHVEVAVSKLKRRHNVEVTLKAPKIPYRETIRGKADAQGRYVIHGLVPGDGWMVAADGFPHNYAPICHDDRKIWSSRPDAAACSSSSPSARARDGDFSGQVQHAVELFDIHSKRMRAFVPALDVVRTPARRTSSLGGLRRRFSQRRSGLGRIEFRRDSFQDLTVPVLNIEIAG